MISFVSGNVIEINGSQVVIELPSAGIGIEVTVSAAALAGLYIGQPGKLLTEFIVREDGWQLYGFVSADERLWFKQLHAISGIGPKTAMATLSVLGVSGIVNAVSSGDEAALVSVPGLGKKSAGRIVLELKDKVKFAASAPNIELDVVAALINLGWNESVARNALSNIQTQGLDTSQVLREALAKLAKS
jgi:Holliday junction DNA helicase RuvA